MCTKKNGLHLSISSLMFLLYFFVRVQISFSEDDSVPCVGNAVIENKQLSEAVLDSIIGEHGVSPAAKCSIAKRVSELLVCEKPGSELSSVQ